MADVLGWRKKFGILGPSTNTVVQPDFDDLRPAGVTNHYSRIVVDNANAISDQSFMQGAWKISDNTADAVRGVLTCDPDFLIMGMSAVTFFGGAKGAEKWQADIEDIAGLKVCTGSASLIAALQTYGNVKNIAFISPYFPAANAEVTRFLQDYGYHIVRDKALQCPSWTAIAEVTEDRMIREFKALDGDDVDAFIQVGTNLSMIRLAAAAELWLQKPVIAINTATYWHGLRQNGINDKMVGFGRLMQEF